MRGVNEVHVHRYIILLWRHTAFTIGYTPFSRERRVVRFSFVYNVIMFSFLSCMTMLLTVLHNSCTSNRLKIDWTNYTYQTVRSARTVHIMYIVKYLKLLRTGNEHRHFPRILCKNVGCFIKTGGVAYGIKFILDAVELHLILRLNVWTKLENLL